MKGRSQRLKTIRHIIRSNRVSSQEILLSLLENEGFSVTQATLSRDLKSLRVGKVSEGEDGYYYTMPSEEERRESERAYLQDVQRGFIGMEFSANIAVVRTLPGHANSVAAALDNLGLGDVIGTVAGDDTIILVLREDSDREEFREEMRQRIPEVEV